MENIALTESTYYILLALYPCAKKDGSDSCPWNVGAAKKSIS